MVPPPGSTRFESVQRTNDQYKASQVGVTELGSCNSVPVGLDALLGRCVEIGILYVSSQDI